MIVIAAVALAVGMSVWVFGCRVVAATLAVAVTAVSVAITAVSMARGVDGASDGSATSDSGDLD